MKKIFLLIVILFIYNLTKAQKFELTYGAKLGLNTSFIDSKAVVDYSRFHELDRDINLNSTTEIGLGYNVGIFINLMHITSRLNIESGFQIAAYNNNHTISLDYIAYSSTPPTERWIPKSETENLKNEFSTLNIPFILGYNFIKREKYNLTLMLGFSYNIFMKEDDHVKLNENFEENSLYKDFFLSYQAGIKADFNKIICTLKYERSNNIQEASSRDYFPWEMKVEGLYLNNFSIVVGYKLN